MRLIILFALAFAATGALGAQSASGTIRGVVTDTTGVPVPESRVRILGTERISLTDSEGRFALADVPPGQYRVLATRIEFTPHVDTAVVHAGTTVDMRFALRRQRHEDDIVVVPWTPPEDTRPAFAALTDPVARLAKLPRLRPIPEHWKQRELRLWVGFGLTYPMQLVRVTDSDSGVVTGELWHWVATGLPDPAQPRESRVQADSIPIQVRRQFRCEPFAVDTLRNGPSLSDGLVVACRVRFRSPPDWGALLRLLEALGVWTLPDESRVPHTRPHFDGVSLVVEAWNGNRYRTYHYGDPQMQSSAEAHQAAAILGEITRLTQRDGVPH